MSRLARLAPLLAACLVAAAPSVRAGTWSKLNKQPGGFASTLFLLPDGRVLCNLEWSVEFWILTPDAVGSYKAGTWTKAKNATYDRLYYASGVMGDGRVIFAGGEYGSGGDKVEIYNPSPDTWCNAVIHAAIS